jgi:hypothetical protein
MATKLFACLVFFTHQTILEQFFAHEIIVPSLLNYYPCFLEAKAQQHSIESFRTKLGNEKIMCFRKKLVRRDALLETIMHVNTTNL